MHFLDQRVGRVACFHESVRIMFFFTMDHCPQEKEVSCFLQENSTKNCKGWSTLETKQRQSPTHNSCFLGTLTIHI